jgi:AraC family transcriptional regulator
MVKPDCSVRPFYGAIRREDRVAGFTLTERVYEPGLHIPWHAHACPYFCLVLRGAYTESYGSRDGDYGPLTVVFHPEGDVHSDRFHGSGGRLFNVAVPPPWGARVREEAPLLDHRVSVEGGPPAWLATRLYREFQSPDGLSPFVVEGLILEILGEIVRRPEGTGGAPRWLREAAEVLRDRFRENLSLDEVARTAGVHPAHLARSFRRHFGCSAGEYVRRLRVEHACRELCRREAPLAEIALEAGFGDQSHLTVVFKRHTGLTPAAYRKFYRKR